MSLLLQPVEINLPDTVGAAMRQTGFSLCTAAERSSLYMLPLPATHRHSRRIPLRDALQKEKLARQDAPAQGLYVVTLRYQETSAG
ncbi:hypothetical protein OUQ87_005084 [Klebsiella variicola]|uniref:hypothetical protein n=1 Tax=Klebsiella variicola TaxID=244366 RepID=UPI0006522758|nr:hypothetical protein [Klebsiella variicola]EKV8437155.1 hypothetical protein [Klebsiella variicola]KMI14287.1 hypothetical protein SM85_02056 [Klebsiella variicola]